MSFSSRIRTKKNISLPDIENADVFNPQRCYNPHRRYPSGPVQNTLPITHARRPQQGIPIPTVDNELETSYSSISPAEISNPSVDCILPGELMILNPLRVKCTMRKLSKFHVSSASLTNKHLHSHIAECSSFSTDDGESSRLK